MAEAVRRDDLFADLLEPRRTHPDRTMTGEGLPVLLRLVVPDLADHFDRTNEHLLLKSFLQPLDLGLGEIQELAAAVHCLFDAEG